MTTSFPSRRICNSSFDVGRQASEFRICVCVKKKRFSTNPINSITTDFYFVQAS